MFQLKRRGKCSELPLQHLLAGLKKVKCVLLSLHPIHASTIMRTYVTLLVSLRLLRLNQKSVIVECPPKNSLVILKDKKIFSDPYILLTTFWQTSVLGLTGNVKVFKPFWNEQCLELSKKLWWPTETDSVDSAMNSSSLYSKHAKLNSEYSMIQRLYPLKAILQTTSLASSTSTRVETWAGEDTPKLLKTREILKCRKFKIYPSAHQKKIFKRWMGTSRYVWNRALDGIRKGVDKPRFMELRNKYVTYKNNDNVSEWEIATPKDIRAGALRDLEKTYKTCFSQLKTGLIRKFDVSFRSKKKGESSMEIPKTSIKLLDKGKVKIYGTFTRKKMRLSKDFRKFLKSNTIEHNCRLKREISGWYLVVPFNTKVKHHTPTYDTCALDPGSRKFQTLYSPSETVKFRRDPTVLKKLQEKQKILQRLRSKKKLSSSKFKKCMKRLYAKHRNLVYDMHDKVINYLVKGYSQVFLPKFETQKLVKKSGNRKLHYDLYQQSHYRFRHRLLDKSKEYINTKVIICTEEYTTMTCTCCGTLNYKVGGSEKFQCLSCGLVIDRDINAARNIYIKCMV